MENLRAAVCSIIETAEDGKGRSSQDVAATVSEYKYLAEHLAGQYGALCRTFISRGHYFVFDDPDAAIEFGLSLIQAWSEDQKGGPNGHSVPSSPVRIGCHFGECIQLEDGSSWIGRAIDFAEQLANNAAAQTLFVTGNIFDTISMDRHRLREAGSYTFADDRLPTRDLYELTPAPVSGLGSETSSFSTGIQWFLKALALASSPGDHMQEEVEGYRQAIELRPDYPEAHNNLAVVLRASGDDAGSAHHYREALELRPDYPEAHYNYAVLLGARGSVAGAVEHCRSAIELLPEYVDAHYLYANLLRQTESSTEADQHYAEALRLRPEYAEVHNNYAILLEDLSRVDEARRHYETALQIDPGYAEAHYNHAILFSNEGREDEAAEQYRLAIDLRPDYPEAHNNLAIVLQQQQDAEGAEYHYKEAIRLRPDDPEAHYNFALMLEQTGDKADAQREFRMAYEVAPSEWVEAMKRQSGFGSGRSPAVEAAGLTRREEEVLRLLAQGRSNRQIAEELFISESTVGYHVTNILGKVGAANRTEAAGFATRNGLAPG